LAGGVGRLRGVLGWDNGVDGLVDGGVVGDLGEPLVGGTQYGSADAALVELRTGVVGSTTVELRRALGRQCTRSARTNFPPPDGYERWSDDAVDHLLADMFARPDPAHPDEGHKFVLNCYLRATDGPSLERLLLTAIENFLKDQGKKTERGKLRRRLQGLLQGDRRFHASAEDRWTLTGGSPSPWQGDLAALERAAFAVRGVEFTRWNTAGPTPKDTATALLVITEAVLAAASGSVRTDDLARVLQGRFRLLRQPRFVSYDDETVGLTEIPMSEGGGSPHVALRARRLFGELTSRERQLVPLLAEPQRWPAVLDVGTAVAQAAGESLIEKLRLATLDNADHEEVVLRLVQMCDAHHVVG
jgi:hypothetical protein